MLEIKRLRDISARRHGGCRGELDRVEGVNRIGNRQPWEAR